MQITRFTLFPVILKLEEKFICSKNQDRSSILVYKDSIRSFLKIPSHPDPLLVHSTPLHANRRFLKKKKHSESSISTTNTENFIFHEARIPKAVKDCRNAGWPRSRYITWRNAFSATILGNNRSVISRGCGCKTSVGEPCARSGGYLKGGGGVK